MKHLILSFDGGGTRMVLQYTILKRIIEKYPNFLSKVSVYAGTSAGSILATGLATGVLDGKESSKLISEDSIDQIFSRNLYRKVTSVKGIFKSKYSNENLRTLLERSFGSRTFKDLEKRLFIPIFMVNDTDDTPDHDRQSDLPKWMSQRVKRWHPVYHHNLDDTKMNSTLVKSLLKSSAAPYYFPVVNGCIDGGIGNNNPSLAVLSQLVSTGVKIEDIYILSFGSGEKPTTADFINEDCGALEWIPYILDMIFDSTQEVVSQSLYNILKDRFWRIQPVLKTEIDLDDASQYQTLVDAAMNHNLDNTLKWIGHNFIDVPETDVKLPPDMTNGISAP